MRILWLPHQDWGFIRRGQREYRIARSIEEVHDFHFLTWKDIRSNPTEILSSLRSARWRENGFAIHQTRRIPNFLGRRLHERSGRGLRFNEWLHARAVRRIVAREGIDLVVCGISHQAVGLPPHDLDVPLVFDYLDFKLERWPDVEAAYFERADAVLCTSNVLLSRATQLHPHCYYLPNGVDLAVADRADGTTVRTKYDLVTSKVVSLIGITASTRLFYVDALAEAARDVPGLTFLLVGDGGELAEAIIKRARERQVRIVVTGAVDPSEVADFFAATDVGLYPGDQNAYFDAACPLKILEYTATKKPVVATDLEELRNWNFPSVRLARPTAEAFAQQIKLALAKPHNYPDLSSFDWLALSDRLLRILEEVAERGKLRKAAS